MHNISLKHSVRLHFEHNYGLLVINIDWKQKQFERLFAL